MRKCKKKHRSFSQILKSEILRRLKQEKIIIFFFLLALIYILISNIVSKCSPIECGFANLGNALDEFVKNVCYGIVAGILFYLINDFYKNVVKHIQEMDTMFHELHKLQVNACYMVQAICGDNYDKIKSREQMFQCMMKCLCNEKEEFKVFGNLFKFYRIKVEDYIFLIDKWKEANKLQRDFLSAYGDLLQREEIYRLNSFDNNLLSETIRYIDMQIYNSNKEFVEIRECDITIIVNIIISNKIYLTDLARKYIYYAYRAEFF